MILPSNEMYWVFKKRWHDLRHEEDEIRIEQSEGDEERDVYLFQELCKWLDRKLKCCELRSWLYGLFTNSTTASAKRLVRQLTLTTRLISNFIKHVYCIRFKLCKAEIRRGAYYQHSILLSSVSMSTTDALAGPCCEQRGLVAKAVSLQSGNLRKAPQANLHPWLRLVGPSSSNRSARPAARRSMLPGHFISGETGCLRQANRQNTLEWKTHQTGLYRSQQNYVGIWLSKMKYKQILVYSAIHLESLLDLRLSRWANTEPYQPFC